MRFSTLLLIISLVFGGCIIARVPEWVDLSGQAREEGAEVPVLVLSGHTGRVIDVEFIPRLNMMYSLSADSDEQSTIRLWHAASGNLKKSFVNERFLDLDLALSPDGSRLGIGSMTFVILRTEDHKVTRMFQAESYQHEKVVDIEMEFDWPFALMKNVEVSKKYRYVTSVTFSGDGRFAVSGHENHQVKVWETGTEKLFKTLEMHSIYGPVTDVAFSPDGRYIAASQEGYDIWIWGFPDYRLSYLKGHTHSVKALSFDPFTGLLASASSDGTIRIWDIESLEETKRLEGHSKGVRCISFTSDGLYLASGGEDGTVRVWEASTGREILLLEGHGKNVNSVSFNSNASLLASAGDDMTVRIWDISSYDLGKDPALVPESAYPVKLDGRVRLDDDSGDGTLSTGEEGRIIVTLENTGEGTAYRLVTMIVPDAMYDGIALGKAPMVPMILPGGSAEIEIQVVGLEKLEQGEAGFSLRVFEFNGFHLSRPVKFTIPTEER